MKQNEYKSSMNNLKGGIIVIAKNVAVYAESLILENVKQFTLYFIYIILNMHTYFFKHNLMQFYKINEG